jgi:hypothetical protein
MTYAGRQISATQNAGAMMNTSRVVYCPGLPGPPPARQAR